MRTTTPLNHRRGAARAAPPLAAVMTAWLVLMSIGAPPSVGAGVAEPADSSAEGSAESVEKLKDRVLTYRGHLSLSSDATTLHYSYTRQLLRDGALVRTKTWREAIPRDLQ